MPQKPRPEKPFRGKRTPEQQQAMKRVRARSKEAQTNDKEIAAFIRTSGSFAKEVNVFMRKVANPGKHKTSELLPEAKKVMHSCSNRIIAGRMQLENLQMVIEQLNDRQIAEPEKARDLEHEKLRANEWGQRVQSEINSLRTVVITLRDTFNIPFRI